MKTTIKSVIPSIRVGEIPALANAMVEKAKKCAAVTKSDLFSAAFTELEDLTKQSISTLNTEKVSVSLDELDSARDAAWRALGVGLEGHAALQKGENKEAALSLLEESAIEEFSTDAMKAKAKNLGGVENALSALKEAQTAFSAQFSEVSNQTATAKNTKSSSELKKMILSCINDKIVPLLSAAALILPADYADFTSAIGEDIARANASASRRSTKKTE